ncbi:MAG: NUDIX hydrolase [Acidobacteriia bacterium]|nr:NUDIX hydrolase [Terriglobia bacterium]
MHRELLLKELAAHQPFDETERRMLARLQRFVEENPECFSPALPEGHITGAAWILDFAREHVLLTHHLKLDKWLQLGGHAEGETHPLAVALREAREESGLTGIRPLSDRIFDVDVHLIPARECRPEHFHYDIRYLMEADRDLPLRVSSESKALSWVKLIEIRHWSSEESITRMAAKSLRFFPG